MAEMTMTIYAATVKYIQEHQYPPTLHELGEITGLKSTSNVRYHLGKLKGMGLVKLIPNISRGIVVVDGVVDSPVPEVADGGIVVEGEK